MWVFETSLYDVKFVNIIEFLNSFRLICPRRFRYHFFFLFSYNIRKHELQNSWIFRKIRLFMCRQKRAYGLFRKRLVRNIALPICVQSYGQVVIYYDLRDVCVYTYTRESFATQNAQLYLCTYIVVDAECENEI